jgi:hypothetical protein
MKNKNLIKTFASALFVMLCLTSGTALAQNKVVPNKLEVTRVADVYMMKDGKMQHLKDGNITRMEKSVTLANGTKVKCNGKYALADGSKGKLQEGNCIDNAGKIDNCMAKTSYTCSMHPQIVSGKPGKCLVCGMALVEKK